MYDFSKNPELGNEFVDLLEACCKFRACRKAHITWFSQHRNAASQRGGGEGLRLQSQGGGPVLGKDFATCTEFTIRLRLAITV
jgi:hypothetical protein